MVGSWVRNAISPKQNHGWNNCETKDKWQFQQFQTIAVINALTDRNEVINNNEYYSLCRSFDIHAKSFIITLDSNCLQMFLKFLKCTLLLHK